MTKAELIDKIASGAGLSKTDASKALDAALNAIKASLKKGRRLRLWDSGHFRSQSARQGRDATRGQVRR